MHASYPDTQTSVLWAIAWHLWVLQLQLCGAHRTCMVFLWRSMLSDLHLLRELAFTCLMEAITSVICSGSRVKLKEKDE